MSFFKRQDIGRIYVLRMVLPDDTVIHKIGMTNSNRSTDRMMEILRSWFVWYRFVPYTELRLDKETGYPEELEGHIHKVLAHKRWKPNGEVEGKTEMFTEIDEIRLLHYIRCFEDYQIKKGISLTEDDYYNLGQLIAP